MIRERTGGTPFFIEEMVQTLVEDGRLAGTKGSYRLTRPVATLALPATVQAVLAARIDRPWVVQNSKSASIRAYTSTSRWETSLLVG
jgi:hypothetical protein